jgi:integrase
LTATVLKQISLVEDKNSYAEVGKAFTKKLKKHPIWQEIEKTNSDITPYSLRHRFAHQCHTGSRYPISIKDAAEAMGHTVDVHNGSYASYTDEMSVERAFDLHNKERITL